VALRPHHVQGRQSADLHLLLVIGERLLRQRQGTFFYLAVFVGIHQVPVDVLDLAYRRDDLSLEGFLGDLLVILGNAYEARIHVPAPTLQQVLGQRRDEGGIDRRVGEGARAVVGETVVLETYAQRSSRRETLRIADIADGRVLREHRDNGGSAGAGSNVV